jgi:hypothetical protein
MSASSNSLTNQNIPVFDDFLASLGPSAPPKTFLDRANILLARDIPIIPLLPKSKDPCTPHAAYDATSDPDVIDEWARKYDPSSNCAAVASFDAFWMVDDDRGTLAAKYKADTCQDLPSTFAVKTSRGFHYYFLHDAASRLIRYDGHDNSGVIDTPDYKGEARCNRQYVVAPGSIHPSGALYEICNDAPIVAAPVQLLDWLQKAYALSESLKIKSKKPKSNRKADPGFNKLFDAIGYQPLVRRINALPNAQLHLHHGLQRGKVVPCPMPHHEHADYSDCFGPIQDVPEVLHCLGNCGWSGDMVAAVYQLDGGSATYKNMYDCARAICKEESLSFEEFFPANPPAETVVESDTSPTEPNLQNGTDEPVPQLSDEALYGLPGDIVKKINPETESHPAGLLVQTLMYFGNIIGRTAYFQVESTRHYGNLFAVRVGVSSKSRKGTGGDRIDAVYENVDPFWFQERKRSGLSSGEGLIVAIHDAILEENKNGELVVVEENVRDKRLLSYEGEFAQVLSVMQRQGATIATNLRNAWDGKTMRTMTIKPRSASDHTISVLGDTTKFDLVMLKQQDANNGFANRFLWVHVYRTKYLPFGGEELDFTPEVERLRVAIAFAKKQKRVFMDRNAREMWARAYERLAVEQDGLFGVVTSRGEAQVLRLALLYALMDCSTHIRSEHLRAALAFWQYCEDSARHIFGGLTEEQKMILEFLRENGSQMKTVILKDLFQRHRPAGLINTDLAMLMKRGLVGKVPNKKGTEIYFALGRK